MTIKPLRLNLVGPPSPWGAPITLQIPGDKSSLMNLYGAKINLGLSFASAPSSVTIIKPSISWVTSYVLTVIYNVNGKKKTKSYVSMSNRGDVGYVLSLMNRSAANTSQEAIPENINAQTITGQLYSTDIPLQYLFDFAEEDRWLPINSMTLQMNFDIVQNIFFSLGATPNFSPIINLYQLLVQSAEPGAIMDPRQMVPSEMITKSYTYTWPIGQTVGAFSIGTVGLITEIFYFFMNLTPSTSTTVGAYNLNPNPYSVMTYNQLDLPSGSYPQQPNYAATYVAGGNQNNVNTIYFEFLHAIDKYNPYHNTAFTYQMWLDNIRPYAIVMNNPRSVDIGTIVLNIQLSQPTVNPANLVIFARCEPTMDYD
jgi:hypothetical protein